MIVCKLSAVCGQGAGWPPTRRYKAIYTEQCSPPLPPLPDSSQPQHPRLFLIKYCYDDYQFLKRDPSVFGAAHLVFFFLHCILYKMMSLSFLSVFSLNINNHWKRFKDYSFQLAVVHQNQAFATTRFCPQKLTPTLESITLVLCEHMHVVIGKSLFARVKRYEH